MIEVTDRHVVHSFFADRLDIRWSEDFRGVLHVPEEYQSHPMSLDHVAIAVAYNAFIGKTCCMHSVIQRPDLVSRRIVRETFEFPFHDCDCNTIIALVDSSNDAAINFDTKLGFKEIHRIPDGGLDGDLVILQMRRQDCRWLRKDH